MGADEPVTDERLRDDGRASSPAPAPALSARHLAYFRFIDACGRPGCPMCRLVDDASRRYLAALLHEQVNDVETRRALRAAGGFCNWHTWMLRDVPDSAFGAAVLAEDVLARAIERFDGLRRLGARRRRVRARLASRIGRWLWHRAPAAPGEPRDRRARCPACADAAGVEARAADTVLEFIGDLQFRRAYEGSTGLCTPHLALTLARAGDHPAAEEVLALSLARWTTLRRALQGFIGKHDYRQRAPFTEEESAALEGALVTLAGIRGLFGNDLRGPSPPGGGGRPAAAPAPGTAGRDAAPPDDAAAPAGAEAWAFERARLELRIRELTQQLNEASTRAAALHWRLSRVAEDRNVLELNLSGERGTARLAERALADLRAESERLRAEQERLVAENTRLRARLRALTGRDD